MEVDARELAWAAGVFEGEGTMYMNQSFSQLMLAVAMADQDSMERFHRAIGNLGHMRTYLPKGGRKQLWMWQCGKFEHTQAVIAMLWYGLGERRRARAIELLQEYANRRAGNVYCAGQLVRSRA